MPIEPATGTGRIIEQNRQEVTLIDGMAEARVSFHIGTRARDRARARAR